MTVDPRAIVEDAQAYLPLRRSTERLEAPDVVLRHRPSLTPHWFGSATRVRFADGAVERRHDDIRRWFADRGRQAFNWQLGPSSTPRDLEARLIAGGARPEPEDPDALAMLLDREPPPSPPNIRVRRVASLQDHREALRITMHEASSEAWATAEAGMDAAWAEARDDHAMFSYLADDGGDPIAMAQLVWLTVGLAYLGGATTLPGARGRGAFRALVRARWDEVVAAGKPVLLVQAGRMSAPILEGLGFETIVPTRVLIDSSSRA